MANKLNDKAWDIGFHREIGDESNPTWSVVIGGTSNALHIIDPLNAGTDWNVSAATAPTVYLHGSATAPTDYMKITSSTITMGASSILYGTTMQINAGGTAIRLTNAASWQANGTGTAAAIGPLYPGASATCKYWVKILDVAGSLGYIPVYGL